MKPQTLKIGHKFLAALAGVVVLWAFWFYQPERQLDRAHQRLIHAVESRNWGKIRDLTSDDFMAGVYDKDESIAAGIEVLRPFRSITFTEDEESRDWERPRCTISSRFHMEGIGIGYADTVVSTVNSQKDPFVFTWQRMSRKPWDWKLIRVEHPLLN